VTCRPAPTFGLLSALVLSCAVGCQAAGARFLSLIGVQKHPFSVALVTDKAIVAAQGFNPFPAYGPLQEALSQDLGQPVAVDVCFPFQARAGFDSGWYDLAVVTPAQFALFGQPDTLRVLTVSVDKQGRVLHSAVLVVAADAPMQTAADLRGKVVAFGPEGDTLTHYAGLQLLREAGLRPADLALDALPLPGSLRHLPDGRAVAQVVLSGSAVAGFVDDTTWEAFPDHAARADELARDKLRVIGRTIALPMRLQVAAPRLDQATADRMRAFLLTVGEKHPEVMEPLQSSGYTAPTQEMLAGCCSLVPIETTSQPAETPATQPAGDG
jgi:ABC-type phosphate/phosphonate transport system substrate-binding protein